MMKALEILLEKVFKDNYFQYLKDRKNTLKVEWLDKNLSKYLVETLGEFTCGNALHMAMRKVPKDTSKNNNLLVAEKVKDEYIPRTYFCEFCESNGIKNARNFVQQLGDELARIVDRRNRTAHKSRVLRHDADEVFDILITIKKFISKLYKDFGFCF